MLLLILLLFDEIRTIMEGTDRCNVWLRYDETYQHNVLVSPCFGNQLTGAISRQVQKIGHRGNQFLHLD